MKLSFKRHTENKAISEDYKLKVKLTGKHNLKTIKNDR